MHTHTHTHTTHIYNKLALSLSKRQLSRQASFRTVTYFIHSECGPQFRNIQISYVISEIVHKVRSEKVTYRWCWNNTHRKTATCDWNTNRHTRPAHVINKKADDVKITEFYFIQPLHRTEIQSVTFDNHSVCLNTIKDISVLLGYDVSLSGSGRFKRQQRLHLQGLRGPRSSKFVDQFTQRHRRAELWEFPANTAFWFCHFVRGFNRCVKVRTVLTTARQRNPFPTVSQCF